MKALNELCLRIKNVDFTKIISSIVILFFLTFMMACTADDLPSAPKQEIVMPDADIEADGDVDDPIKVIVTIPPTPPKK